MIFFADAKFRGYLSLTSPNLLILYLTTIQQLRDPINSDTLIFDISTADSPRIALIEDISFDGDIVVFSSEDLLENLRSLRDRQFCEKYG